MDPQHDHIVLSLFDIGNMEFVGQSLVIHRQCRQGPDQHTCDLLSPIRVHGVRRTMVYRAMQRCICEFNVAMRICSLEVPSGDPWWKHCAEWTCPLCLEGVEAQKETQCSIHIVRSMCCSNVFHRTCMEALLVDGAYKCPMCRCTKCPFCMDTGECAS